jgi:hypothetical protein
MGNLGAYDWDDTNVVTHTLALGGNKRSVCDEDLTMDGTITISRDVYIIAYQRDIEVNVQADTTIVPATDETSPPQPGGGGNDGKAWGHLIFFAAGPSELGQGPDVRRTIIVNVDYDLTFQGVMTYSTDLIVTFSGQGVVIFKLRDDHSTGGMNRGVIVSFTGNCGFGPISEGGSPEQDAAQSFGRGGTRVYILMDQDKDQVMNRGVNKVVFQRVSYDGTNVAGLYPYRGQPTGVVVGPASFITYLSTNPTGKVNAQNPLGAQESQEVWSNGDYGTLAFDPTHAGAGRLYLEIQGDPASQIVGVYERINGNYNFQDGAVIVCGNYVPDFSEPAIREWAFLNAHAGRRAIFRVIDNLAFERGTMGPYDPKLEAQRGLLVINKNTTVPALAADPYQSYLNFISTSHGFGPYSGAGHPNNHPEYYGESSDRWYWARDYSYYRAPYCWWAYPCCWPRNPYWDGGSNGYPAAFNTRTGFVLGANGWMDIYHATFFDHVACNYGELQYFAVEDNAWASAYDYTAWDPGWYTFKWRNPAAFCVDGLNYYDNFNDYQYYYWGLTEGAEGTIYNDPAGTYFPHDPTLHAHIHCYGNGSLYFRCAAANDGIVEDYGPYDPGTGNYNYLFFVEQGQYDGQYISSQYTSPGEGEGVIDLEGPLSVYGHPRNEAPRVYTSTTGYEPNPGEMGSFGMPTLNLDHRGLETGDWETILVDRPLRLNGLYYISNSPHMFCNSIANFYDVVVRHTDVTKLMTTDPSMALPAIVGGEAKFFNDTYNYFIWDQNLSDWLLSPHNFPHLFNYYQYPMLRFYGSELQMHESLVASGVRFVVKERERMTFEGARVPFGPDAGNHMMLYGSHANNTSTFRFYDHGDKTDTMLSGYGRMFMVGSGMNRASSYNPYYSSFHPEFIAEADYYDGSDACPCREVWTNNTYASAFVNVYRGREVTPPFNTARDLYDTDPGASNWADTIKLSIQAANDNPDVTQLRAQLTNDDEYGWNRAHHLFLLSRGDDTETWCCNNGYGRSYMSIGWTFTFGNDHYHPWQMRVGEGIYHFPIGTDVVTPATCSVDGNFIYFGGTDWKGKKAVVPVMSPTQGSVIYVNHGGRFTITQPQSASYDPQQHGYDMFMDTALAYRMWGSESLFGIIDVPKDQVIYGHGFGRQPYDVNINLSREHIEDNRYGLRVRTANSTSVVDPDRASASTGRYSRYFRQDLHSGEEVIIPWGRHSRIYDRTGVPPGPFAGFIPAKTLPSKSEMLTRFTANIDQPPTLPQNMFFFTAGDYVTQLKVPGATQADPLNLLVTGNNGAPGAARISEIVSIPTNPMIHGEGAHGIIFLNHGGRVGLGSRDFNEHSDNAWNLLGKDYVTICADGDGVVNVNSNLLVTDNGAIVATTLFGADTTEYGLADDSPRLTIFSEQPHEIRVPRGVELDLGTFAKQLGTTPHQQVIKFGGALRLIFEPGSTLRFPSIDTVTGDTTPRPVLYMSDDTELIFEGDLEESKGRHMDIRSTDSAKTLIVGHGEIWLNKNARMVVNDEAMVRVGSDPRTPTPGHQSTDLLISIRRQGQFVIGTEQVAGGSFEVGNAVDMDNYYNESELQHPINFQLVINGPKARFHMDREAFLGFGVGIVNKTRRHPNGDADPTLNPDTLGAWNPDSQAWEVQALHNVHKVSVVVTQGVFDHSNIFDGNDRRASLLAVGPVTAYEEFEGEGEVPGSYTFEFTNPVRSRVLGGGNIMALEPAGETYPGRALVNIWNYADAAARPDGTWYSILGSGQVLQQHIEADFTGSTLTDVTTPQGNGHLFVTGIGGFRDFFTYLASIRYSLLPEKLVNIGMTEFEPRVAYVNASDNFATGAEIYRRDNIFISGEGNPEDGLEWGVLGARGSEIPVSLNVIFRRSQ